RRVHPSSVRRRSYGNRTRMLQGGTPVVAFGAGDASHRRTSAAAMRVAVTVAMEATRRAAKPAIDRAAIGPAVRARHGLQPRATATSPHKAHRYGADSGGTHQCQHDTTRAFHIVTPGYCARC